MKRNFQSLWSPARVLPVFLSLGKQMCIAACPEGWQNRAVLDQQDVFWTRGPTVALRWSCGASTESHGAGQPLCPPITPLSLTWTWGGGDAVEPSSRLSMGLQNCPQHHSPGPVPTGRAELVSILCHIPGYRVRKGAPGVGQGLLSLPSPRGGPASVVSGSCSARWDSHSVQVERGLEAHFYSNKSCFPDCR